MTSFLTTPIGTRWHLVEIHDLEICPNFIRAAVVELLELGWTTLPIPSESVAIKGVRKFLTVFAREQVQTDVIVDMASGGGGPLPVALEGTGLKLVITDYFPQPALWANLRRRFGHVHTTSESVDATKIEIGSVLRNAGLQTASGRPPVVVRTICGALHHFQPRLVQGILRDAVAAGDGVAFFEPLIERTILSIALMCIILPVLAFVAPLLLLATGRVTSPKELLVRCFFTYCVPIFPFVLWLDGMVSCLRVYSPGEFMALTKGIDHPNADKYLWQVTRTPAPLGLGSMLSYTGVLKK